MPHRSSVIGLVITVMLVVAGTLLARTLHRSGDLEDCILQGRTNCAPMAVLAAQAPDASTR